VLTRGGLRGTGAHDQVRTVVTARAKPGKSRLVPGGPPANARVTFVSVGSTLEVTAAGVGAACRSRQGVVPIAQDARC
jgi:hypothetical protein